MKIQRTMTLIRAIDFSQYQGDVGKDIFEKFHDDGIRMFVGQGFGSGPQGPRVNPRINEQLTYAKELGWTTAIYTTPYAAGSAIANVEKSLRDNLSFVALDVEGNAGVDDDDVRTVVNMGLQPAIYTSTYYWNHLMGSNDNFKHLPLWDAYYLYNREPKAVFPNFIRVPGYGGWDRSLGWQFAGDIHSYINVDFSVFDVEYLLEIGTMTPEVEKAIREIAKEEAKKFNDGHYNDTHSNLNPVFLTALELVEKQKGKLSPQQQRVLARRFTNKVLIPLLDGKLPMTRAALAEELIELDKE